MTGLAWKRTSSSACSIRTSASASGCGEPQISAARSVGGQLALRGEEDLHDARGDRAEDEEERSLEQPADPARLDEPAGDQHDRGLDEGVAVAGVGELVGEDALELGGREQGDAGPA